MKKRLLRGAVRILAAILMLSVLVQAAETDTGNNLQTETAEMQTSAELENLYARGAVLMDGDSGRILYEKNGREVLPMASTTKIMTCILALELADGGEICSVTQNAAAQPQVHLGMRTGETYYLKDLLYSMMLESHNDSAVCVAEHVGGSVENFAELMNNKAREIGCTDTHYVTPNGLDGEDEGGIHSTTAEDLARVMRYCIRQSEKREAFLEITRTAAYSFQDVSGQRSFSCVNHNALLTMMDGALSGKTGYTGSAGYCYVGAVEREGGLLIVALLACGWPNHKTYKWSDTGKLVDYGYKYYQKKKIDLSELCLPEVEVLQGVEDHVPVSPDGIGTELTVLMKDGEKVELAAKMPENVQAPVSAGARAGSLEYRVGSWKLAEYPLLYSRDVQRISYAYCLEKVLEKYLL